MVYKLAWAKLMVEELWKRHCQLVVGSGYGTNIQQIWACGASIWAPYESLRVCVGPNLDHRVCYSSSGNLFLMVQMLHVYVCKCWQTLGDWYANYVCHCGGAWDTFLMPLYDYMWSGCDILDLFMVLISQMFILGCPDVWFSDDLVVCGNVSIVILVECTPKLAIFGIVYGLSYITSIYYWDFAPFTKETLPYILARIVSMLWHLWERCEPVLVWFWQRFVHYWGERSPHSIDRQLHTFECNPCTLLGFIWAKLWMCCWVD